MRIFGDLDPTVDVAPKHLIAGVIAYIILMATGYLFLHPTGLQQWLAVHNFWSARDEDQPGRCNKGDLGTHIFSLPIELRIIIVRLVLGHPVCAEHAAYACCVADYVTAHIGRFAILRISGFRELVHEWPTFYKKFNKPHIFVWEAYKRDPDSGFVIETFLRFKTVGCRMHPHQWMVKLFNVAEVNTWADIPCNSDAISRLKALTIVCEAKNGLDIWCQALVTILCKDRPLLTDLRIAVMVNLAKMKELSLAHRQHGIEDFVLKTLKADKMAAKMFGLSTSTLDFRHKGKGRSQHFIREWDCIGGQWGDWQISRPIIEDRSALMTEAPIVVCKLCKKVHVKWTEEQFDFIATLIIAPILLFGGIYMDMPVAKALWMLPWSIYATMQFIDGISSRDWPSVAGAVVFMWFGGFMWLGGWYTIMSLVCIVPLWLFVCVGFICKLINS